MDHWMMRLIVGKFQIMPCGMLEEEGTLLLSLSLDA